jgi:hypothetical protein
MLAGRWIDRNTPGFARPGADRQEAAATERVDATDLVEASE